MRIKKQYASDYRISRSVDEKGRIRESAAYTGKYYVFALPRTERRKVGLPLFGYAVAAVIFFLLPLCILSDLARIGYVVIPHTLTGLALYFFLRGLLPVIFSEKHYAREEADRIRMHYSAAAGCGLIGSGIALVGGIIWCFIGKIFLHPSGNVVFLFCDALMALLFALALKKQKLREMQEEQ